MTWKSHACECKMNSFISIIKYIKNFNFNWLTILTDNWNWFVCLVVFINWFLVYPRCCFLKMMLFLKDDAVSWRWWCCFSYCCCWSSWASYSWFYCYWVDFYLFLIYDDVKTNLITWKSIYENIKFVCWTCWCSNLNSAENCISLIMWSESAWTYRISALIISTCTKNSNRELD